MKAENNMIISIGSEKEFLKTQHLFMTKSLNKLGLRGECTSTQQRPYMTSLYVITANIILNGEILKAFPLNSGIR